MLRAKLDKTNLTPETASAIEANLNGLEQEVDMTGWHIDVFGHPLAPCIDVQSNLHEELLGRHGRFAIRRRCLRRAAVQATSSEGEPASNTKAWRRSHRKSIGIGFSYPECWRMRVHLTS